MLFFSCFKRCAILFLVFFTSYALAFSQDPLTVRLPGLEMMPNTEWFWVGEHMAINGVPMAVKMFTYRGSSDDVIQFYRSVWKGKGHGKLKERKFGDRVVLGYELDGFYYTVQFHETPGLIQGKAVVTPTPLNYKSSKKSSLPIPPRSRVLSKVESLDLGRREETLSIESKFDVSYVVDFYKRQLGDDNWQLFSASGNQRDSAVISFQRGSELLQLTAKRLQHNNSHPTQLLIHWIK